MTTLDRQKKAEEHNLPQNIGRHIKATHHFYFRGNETAEIVGWGLRPDNGRPIYYIRYDNGECTKIPAGELFNCIGYTFVD